MPIDTTVIDDISNIGLDWISILTGRRPAMPTGIDAQIILSQQQLQQQQQTRAIILGGALLLGAAWIFRGR